jgi:radical SAM protein with 4Fe4S-binding SPASM domain
MIDADLKKAYETHRDIGKRAFPSSCYAPFTSLYFNTNGDVIACCKNTNYVLGNIAHESLDEIWKGKRLKALRKALAGYNFKLGCEFCEWQIQGGEFDQVYTKTFDDLPLRGEDPEWPSMLEFTLSNTCNLACVMCYGVLSSTIRSQRENLPPLAKVYDDKFFEDLRKYLPHLKIAKFFGGEPFLAQESYRVWDMMIEDGISIPCHVTTNGTQWNAKVERILEHFPVSLSISVDGATKETAESIRVNMDFETVTRNVERFLDYTRKRGTYMSLTYCLMRQNWHEFGEYLRYGEKLGVDVFINTVIDPADCSLYTLPSEELVDIVRRMDELDARHGFSKMRRNGDQWTSALDALRKNANARQRAGVDSVKDANRRLKELHRPDYVHAAWKLVHAGKPEEAIAEARKVPDTDLKGYEGRLAETQALRDLGRLEEAEDCLDRAIGMWRKNPFAIAERAWVRYDRGNHAGCREDALQAAELLAKGDNDLVAASVHHLLSLLDGPWEERKAHAEKALEFCNKLAVYDTTDATFLRRAYVLEILGRHDEMFADVDRVLAQNPEHGGAKAFYDRAKARQGQS